MLAVAMIIGDLPVPVNPWGAWQFWVGCVVVIGAVVAILLLRRMRRSRRPAEQGSESVLGATESESAGAANQPVGAGAGSLTDQH